jgi:hypothetical protein
MSLVNIELHHAVVAHLQQERLAVVLIPYVDALHDLEGLQGLFAKGDYNLLSIGHRDSLSGAADDNAMMTWWQRGKIPISAQVWVIKTIALQMT